jgi:hypothetical protein
MEKEEDTEVHLGNKVEDLTNKGRSSAGFFIIVNEILFVHAVLRSRTLLTQFQSSSIGCLLLLILGILKSCIFTKPIEA